LLPDFYSKDAGMVDASAKFKEGPSVNGTQSFGLSLGQQKKEFLT
jgi:hypothetical protein